MAVSFHLFFRVSDFVLTLVLGIYELQKQLVHLHLLLPVLCWLHLK